MQPVAQQVAAFLLLIILGNLLGVLFDIYRVLRRVHYLKKWGTNFGDGLFWLFATCITYLFLLYYTWGEVRLYVFVAIAIGALAYLRYLSRFMYLAFLRMYYILRKIIFLIVKAIRIPLRLLWAIFFFPVSLIISFFIAFWQGMRKMLVVISSVFPQIASLLPPMKPPREEDRSRFKRP